jgi:hypothetical protein
MPKKKFPLIDGKLLSRFSRGLFGLVHHDGHFRQPAR